ncbi:MAG: tRNA (adenosine(37)-N6)-threonylcarbamoyltransferase complex ATPase subunit type 1 TsaE [Cyanobacteria bacterium SID2]|nr:tRNA (adenosine(37)-N6)-threonylcarbamoyltransferase complex ATPase subunit type 1 TsaE [Cyanobacteria bacterium SID2]MBP0006406.1 tRNA (adenosine(37)-N6)-threonylcarbamoyltransferase complex ATPase subunit type 1 TsaE [Cyanobacteria bacterium SBC]
MTTTVLFLSDANATHALGVQLGKTLPPRTTLLLEGDLGSGKTTLVQGIGEGLGVAGSIVSPTFTLVNEYLDGRIPLYHLDLYRLHPEEVEDLQPELYWEGVEVQPGITAIEWSERLPYLPNNPIRLRLTQAEESRQIEISVRGELPDGFDNLCRS